MTDVIEIAKKRRARVAEELAKLDEFIRMAEILLERHQSTRHAASDAGREEDSRSREAAGAPTNFFAAGWSKAQ